MWRHLAAWVIGLASATPTYADEKPRDELAAARIAFSLGCLNVVERSETLESQAAALGLAKANQPKLTRWPADEVWRAPSPSGEMYLVEHANESRPCTLAVFGADGNGIKDDLVLWFSGEGAPFKLEKPFDASTGSGPQLRWERGAVDIVVTFTANPDPKNYPDAPMLLATMYLTN